MKLEDLEKLCAEAGRSFGGELKLMFIAREFFPKLIAVVKAAKEVYPSDAPAQEEHEKFKRLADAIANLESDHES